MPSYVITGVSRGIGYELLRQYSSDQESTVIGLVRNRPATDKKISEDADLKGRSNIHILSADISDYTALKRAADETAKILDGKLDYLIANAALVLASDQFKGPGSFTDNAEELSREMFEFYNVNVIANMHLFNLFIPLLLKGQAKKVIAISSGMADSELVRQYDIANGTVYATSKAALNMVIAKYSAQYRDDGLLFLAVCPGMVDTGVFGELNEEETSGLKDMVGKFMKYAPHFSGADTPEQSVAAVRKVIENASVTNGDGGDFLSHFGTKQWI